ncbi:histidine kinase dimerization/phospho-acceptor domain-containing protein [uncultured Shewanella sp.]|uniref:sensor histidine kinase n=1 Tax=uncultured Shewanella sp. TaxID=173975 RepID=UPI00262CEF9E|nr:histidine kinase dimerization/phospho-acceptor domain-containing protein [uncultured Shewanella sp.]
MNELEKLNKRLKRTQAALTAAEDLAENKLRDTYYAQEKLKAEIENRKIIEHHLKTTITEKNKALSVRTQFLQHISHQLKTPMNAIIGMAEVLDNPQEPLTPEQGQCLKIIHQSGENLLNMIENLIQFAQLSSSVYQPSTLNFNLQEMLHDFTQFYLRSHLHKNMHIKTKIAPEIPKVIKADKRVLINIIRQLLSNAIAFSPPGSHITISVSLETENNHLFMLIVNVTDTGIGFPENLLIQVSQANMSPHLHHIESNSGLGLGLILCHIMLNNVGGHLKIKTNDPCGSIVSFTFPAMIKSSP